MRICFVGHAFHKRSASNTFFIDILRTIGTVSEYYTDPDGDPLLDEQVAVELARGRFDRYIFWQTEVMAERLAPLNLGLTIIVPMFDAVSHRPVAYWRRFVRSRFLSFTRCHHEMLQQAGMTSAYFQYFPDARSATAHPRDSEAAFFWERRPESQLNAAFVAQHCRLLGLGRLHIHAAPDFTGDRPSTVETDDTLEVTTSSWSESRDDIDRIAGQSLFVFAPRPLEGIGMAVLEAMARGQIVVAPDRPAANEYVSHLVSGLLYEPGEPLDVRPFTSVAPAHLDEMSRAARRKAETGRKRWLADIPRLVSFIADDGRRWSTLDSSSAFGNKIRGAARRRLIDVG